MEAGYQSLLAVKGVNDKLAEQLYDAGVTSSGELANAPVADLVELEPIDESMAEALIKAAAEVPTPDIEEVEEDNGSDQEEGSGDEAVASDDLAGKTNAELREMCAAAGITGVSKKTKAQLIEVLQEGAGQGGDAE
jgi:transcription termination factor NusA